MKPYSDFQWVLASASPRRLSILRQVGIEPLVRPARIDEHAGGSDPESVALANARAKLGTVAPAIDRGIVLAADTVVVQHGELLGKPRDDGEAARILRRLSGRAHEVITAYTLEWVERAETAAGAEITRVWMRAIGSDELSSYVRSGEPADKAGAYGIQGAAAAFVERIDGCYFTVVGLPIARVLRDVRRMMSRGTPPNRSGKAGNG
ncbi:MAG: Septum formation protein Maf [Calditrichaeota bacterium]|nr:Septum formation protein Maf [Calditrichota bacterium]